MLKSIRLINNSIFISENRVYYQTLCRQSKTFELCYVPAGLLRLPSLQVELAGDGGGGILAESSSRPLFFSLGNSGIFGFLGG